MAVYFMGSEPEIFTSFAGSVTTDSTVTISGQNRAGIAMFDANAAVGNFTSQQEGWLHFRMGRVGTSIVGNFGDSFYLQNNTGQTIMRIQTRSANFTANIVGFNGATYVANLPANIDVQWRIASSGGFVRIWVDNIAYLVFEGDTSLASGEQGASVIIARGTIGTSGGQSTTCTYSQFLVSDLPTLNAKVITLPLTANGVNEWSGSPANVIGTAFAGIANSITELTPDQKIEFDLQNISISLSPTEYIGGLSLSTSALAEIGTVVPKLGASVSDGISETNLTPQTKTSVFTPSTFILNTNPRTSSLWTVQEVNNAKFSLIAKT